MNATIDIVKMNPSNTLNPQLAIERVVTGLGYDLIEVEHAPRGLLRVSIDRVPGQVYTSRRAEPGAAPDTGEFVTVEDCERVTRQLQYALEVDGVDYQRLEVSSPGLDRLLRHAQDYARFAGQAVSVTLKLPLQGRKHWKGVLEPMGEPSGVQWRLVVEHGKGEQALDFQLDEVREARLVPVLDFKGKKKSNGAAAPRTADAGANGGLDR